MVGGAIDAAEGFPGIVADSVTPSDATSDALRAAVQAALFRQPAAIAIWIDDRVDPAAALAEIRAARVPLVSIGVRPKEGGGAHVAIDWAGGAASLAERLTEIADGRKSYILIHEDGRSLLSSSIYASFSAAARQQSSPTLLDDRNVSSGEPRAAVEELLTRFRHAGLVINLVPDAWQDTLPMISIPHEARFGLLSAAPTQWPRLRSGEVAALVGPVAGDIGRAAMELTLQAALREVRGDEVKYIPCELITAATLDDFARRYIAAGALDPHTLKRRESAGGGAP